MGRWPRRAGACLFSLGVAAAAGAQGLRLEPLGETPVVVPGVGNAELSGITWVGGTRYLAVDDGRPRIFPLDVTVDEAKGAIASVAAGEPVSLAGARDLEGVAWLGASRSVLVTDEIVQQLREYDPATGKLLRSALPPQVFRGRMPPNRALEGIAVSPDGSSVWIANEVPLRDDGPPASATSGGWVRLARLDAALAPAGQWAYRTEPGLGFVGVVDLMLAPGGELLVLERALTGAGFASRIFGVDFEGASDVTGVARLGEARGLRAVGKQPLWQRTEGFQNFEGIALGPALASGGRLVLLVSDGGGHRQPTLLALRLLGPGAAGAE